MQKITLLKHQHEFIVSEAKKALLLGGIGSGKSLGGAHFCINMLANYPYSKGLITANTYSQLMNATIETLTSELDRCGIEYHAVLSGSRKRIELDSTMIYLYSLEKPDGMRGIEAGWLWSDETAFAKEHSIQIARGRLRDKNGPLYERHTSSPSGFNFLYDTFENFDGNNKTDSVHLIRAKTIDNVFLPDGYYESLLEDYGGIENPLAMQELGGMFVNLLGGQIYWGFNRKYNVAPVKLDNAFPVYVGQDFNINNMANCYVQYIDGKFHVAQENILEHHGANTDHAASKICRDLKSFRPIVIPDSTGKALKTSARGKTDIDILKSYGLEVLSTRNPLIRDRQNTLNIHFKKENVIIDPSCKTLIKEIETLSSREKEGDSAHASVGLGYVTNKLSPLHQRKKTTWT